MYSRLLYSEREYNGSYYCYAEQLMNGANAVSLCRWINCMNNGEVNANQLICKNICDYITWPKDKLQDGGLIKMIDYKIIFAMQHPFISNHYKVQEIQTMELTKLENNNNNHFLGFCFLIIIFGFVSYII